MSDPPNAATHDKTLTAPHGDRSDPYYWLRDDARADPAMLAHLEAENAHTEAWFARAQPSIDALHAEIVARLKQDDCSVPYRKAGFWYYWRFEAGKEYPIYARKAGTLEAPEQILLDANQLADRDSYYQIGSYEVSPDSRWLAYCEDRVGRREYTLRLKDLRSGETSNFRIDNLEADLVWTNDSTRIVYVAKDPETLLGTDVKQHRIGDDPSRDELLFSQTDNTFYTSVAKSKSDRFIFIGMESTVASEWRFADADAAELAFTTFLPHERDHEYQIEHVGDEFIVRSNWRAANFRLLRTPLRLSTDRSKWQELVAHRDDTFISDFEILGRYVAISQRSGSLRKIRVKPLTAAAGTQEFFIEGDEAAYATYVATNAEIDSEILRYSYTSLTTPMSVYDYDLASGAKTLLKRDEVNGDFDPRRYVTELHFVASADGKQIPVSIVKRRDVAQDGRAPLVQYGYGAYGLSLDPTFSSARLSLLDRGVVYAIAHIRGGQEMGRAWYDQGRLLNKQNTFDDFIAVTRFLVDAGHAARDRVFAMGGSAGGLLMGAIANMAPQLYRGIVAQVPFVDVVTTMLDETIPLTTNEYDEWGDPRAAALYRYMLAYSPYDNVRAQDYPAMLVTTGLWDSQVQYYEPVKWVAKLRRLKTDTRALLLHVDMQAGHGGKSGRFQRYREIAREYAFILSELRVA
jgi:oligopeptidase B